MKLQMIEGADAGSELSDDYHEVSVVQGLDSESLVGVEVQRRGQTTTFSIVPAIVSVARGSETI